VLAFGEVVVVLHGSDWHNRASSLDLICRDLRNADMPDFAAVAIILDSGLGRGFVATKGGAGAAAKASPIVLSLSPPVYE
jgi:hypothetical protein